LSASRRKGNGVRDYGEAELASQTVNPEQIPRKDRKMKRLLHHGILASLVAIVALTGLALAVGPSPAAFAGSHPSVTATGGDGYVSVGGSGFTPKGSVLVEIRLYNGISKKWHLEEKTTVTAEGPHYVCRSTPLGTICGPNPGGQITADLTSQPGKVHVFAQDLTTTTKSNTVTAYVYPIP
jgi:hypothetical protein